MEGTEKQKNTIADLLLAGLVASSDKMACARFVDEYTDWVLYRIYELMKTHCHYSARQRICSLLVLQKQRKGWQFVPDCREQCDECMDSYIWFFEYLKARLKSYKGINDCSLKTYVWSIINSKTTYVDWLRWKYGRVI